MTEEVFYVKSDVEQVALFMQWAEKYKNDFSLEGLQVFNQVNLEDVVEWLIENYREEDGEIIVRPKVYVELVEKTGKGLDCDDATIFLTSYLRYHGIEKDRIFIAEFDDGKSSHIFCGMEYNGDVIWLDNLPGSVFGIHSYDDRFLKITRMSDYL